MILQNLQPPLAIACHDAGAANVIFAWLRATPSGDVRLLVQGPAAALWANNRLSVRECKSVEQLLQGAETLLTGTGWGSCLEHDARRAARQRGLHSIAVIDHWTNYRERFVRCGEVILPDEIWVTDEDAYRIARECFPGSSVRVQANLYIEEQVRGIAEVPLENAELLYVLEPVRSDWGRGVAGEFQALDYFERHAALLDLPHGTPVRLRPHPSEAPGKYDEWLRSKNHPTVLDDSPDLAAAVSRAAWVAGCESLALVIALLAGRKVICTLPPWAPPCRLPHGGLIHLKSIAAAAI